MSSQVLFAIALAVLVGPVFDSLGIPYSNTQQTICPDSACHTSDLILPVQSECILQNDDTLVARLQVPWREKAGARECENEKAEKVVSRQGGWELQFAEQVKV